ncbi:diguanylate cyclase [bacterium]|nr:diguanylate cyclase [bacterium]
MSPIDPRPSPIVAVLIVSDDPHRENQVREILSADPILSFSIRQIHPQESLPPVGRRPTVIVLDPSQPILLHEPLTGLEVVSWPTSREVSACVPLRYAVLRQQFSRLEIDWHHACEQIQQLNVLRRQVTPFDPRTGWHSYAHIVDRCQEEIARAMKYSLPIALVVVEMLNLDDMVGSGEDDGEASEQVVTALAHRIRPICRHGDILGHYGPSSILVILLNTDHQGGERFSERVEQALLPPLVMNGMARSLDWAMALAARDPGMSVTPTELLNQLERRVERARKLGCRGTVLGDA